MDDSFEIEVETLIGQPEGYAAIGQAKTKVPDEDYIEGALRLWVGDEQIVGASDWDLIDQLWAYLVDGLADIGAGKPHRLRFPDQPIELRFDPAGPDQTIVTATVDDEVRSAVAHRPTLHAALVAGAKEMFTQLPRLAPGSADHCAEMLARLAV